ncbi:MAG TPA: hypothetical protein VNJ29_03980 [Candidatus Nitrosotenuis sp.]|nr:hypothetical protein [Candidatus Nitrosotenuis sp.]
MPGCFPLRLIAVRHNVIERLKAMTHYIECLQDQVILAVDQQRMYQTMDCKIITLPEADHSPFSSTPEDLVKAIIRS